MLFFHYIFHCYFCKIITEKIASKKFRETNQQIVTEVGKEERKQDDISTTFASTSTSYLTLSTPRIAQPKPDATDRRQIEAINEEKSHTTKETLNDIKRIHHKEKAKKEQKFTDLHQTDINLVRKTLVWQIRILFYLSY